METKIILTDEGFELKDFLYSETAKRNKIPNQNTITVKTLNRIDQLHSKVLAPLKQKYKDLTITSGYRSIWTNAAVGGVPNSQHLFGEAADIKCKNMTALWYDILNLDIDQAIRYKNFIHVSYVSNGLNRNQFIDKTLNK